MSESGNESDSALKPDGSDVVKEGRTKTRRKRRPKPSGFRKAPQAPKRFKSPYIYFSMARMEELKKLSGGKTKVTSTSKQVSKEWKCLPPSERRKWEEVARRDKIRFMAEKTLYTGPWQVPAKRTKKDPSAPKRPMSAFLFFSQGTRQRIKAENPEMPNTEVSRILGDLWANASEEEKRPHIEKEARERAKYNEEIAIWRDKKSEEEKAERLRREAVAHEAVRHGLFPNLPPPAMTMAGNPVLFYYGQQGFPGMPSSLPPFPGAIPYYPYMVGMPPVGVSPATGVSSEQQETAPSPESGVGVQPPPSQFQGFVPGMFPYFGYGVPPLPLPPAPSAPPPAESVDNESPESDENK